MCIYIYIYIHLSIYIERERDSTFDEAPRHAAVKGSPGHASLYPWKRVTLILREQVISEHFMMDWTRLVSNLLKKCPKRNPQELYAPRVRVRIFD